MRQLGILALLAAIFMPTVEAEMPSSLLRAELASLEVLTNACWDYGNDFEGMELCFNTELDGKLLRAVQTGWDDIGSPGAADVFIYWDPAESRIGYRQYASDGGVAEGWIDVGPDSVSFRGDGIRLSPYMGRAQPHQFRFVSPEQLELIEIDQDPERARPFRQIFQRVPARLNRDRTEPCAGCLEIPDRDSYRRVGVPHYMAASLSHRLAPMEFMVTFGVARQRDAERQYIRRGEPMYGGHFLRQVELVIEPGRSAREETIYYWHAEAGEVRYHTYSSSDEVSRGRVSFDDGGVQLFPDSELGTQAGQWRVELRPGDPQSDEVRLVELRSEDAGASAEGRQLRFERVSRADVVLLMEIEWAPDAPAFRRLD